MEHIPERKESHKIFIAGFTREDDRIVDADEIRVCLPNKTCIQFWVTVVSCFIAMGLGIFLMIYQRTDATLFAIGEALLSVAIGVLFPSPEYTKVFAPTSTTVPVHQNEIQQPLEGQNEPISR